jgi:hypothetical protein
LGTGEIGYRYSGEFTAVATTQLGNVARVDVVYGNDATAYIGGLPFETINAAIAAIIGSGTVESPQNTGVTIWALPGTHRIPATGSNTSITDSNGLTTYPLIDLPATTALRGMNTQTTMIQCALPEQNSTLLKLNGSCRVEDVTLSLGSVSYTGTSSLVGVYFAGATAIQAKLRTMVINVTNSAVSSTSTTTVYGAQLDGTGTLGASTFSFNCMKGATINVFSNGGGTKRGILVSNTNIGTLRDMNVYVAAPATTSSTGSYVGIETNEASGTGSIQLRSTTVGVVTPRAGESYTASDILQTTPVTITDPTYLASAGIQLGPGVDLVTKTAGGEGFSAYAYPTTLYYGLRGELKTGGSPSGAYMWPGTQAATNNVFPDPDTGTPAFYRVQQPFILAGLNVSLGTAPGTGHSTTFTVRRTPAGGTIADVTGFSLVFSNAETDKSFYSGSQTFGAGDKLHLLVSYTGGSANATADITTQLDSF